jgi:hypothetical protein
LIKKAMARTKTGLSRPCSTPPAGQVILLSLDAPCMGSVNERRHWIAGRTVTDQLIIEMLRDVCLSAAAAYSQALADFGGDKRESWRGPATDFA